MDKGNGVTGVIVKRLSEGNLHASIWVNSGRVEYYYKVAFHKVIRTRTGEEVFRKTFGPEDMKSLGKLSRRVSRYTQRYGPLYTWNRMVRFLRAKRG